MKLEKTRGILSDRGNIEGIKDPKDKGFKINNRIWGAILLIFGRTFYDQGNFVNKESFKHYLNRIKPQNSDIQLFIFNKTTKQAYRFLVDRKRDPKINNTKSPSATAEVKERESPEPKKEHPRAQERQEPPVKPDTKPPVTPKKPTAQKGKKPPVTPKKPTAQKGKKPSVTPKKSTAQQVPVQNPKVARQERVVDPKDLFNHDEGRYVFIKDLTGPTFSVDVKRDETIGGFTQAVANKAGVNFSNVVLIFAGDFLNKIEDYDKVVPAKVWEAGRCYLIIRPLLDGKCMQLLDKAAKELPKEYEGYQHFERMVLSITERLFRGKLGDSETPLLLKEYRDELNLMIDAIDKSEATKEEKGAMKGVLQANITLIDYAREKYDEGLKLLGIKSVADYETLILEKLKDLPDNHCKVQENKPTITIKYGSQSIKFDKENLLKHVTNISSFLDDDPNITEFDFGGLNYITPDIFQTVLLYLEGGTLDQVNLEELLGEPEPSEESIQRIEEAFLQLYDAAKSLRMLRLEFEVGKVIMQRMIDNKWKNKELLQPRYDYADNLTGIIRLFLEKI